MTSTLNKRCTTKFLPYGGVFHSPAGCWKAGMCMRVNRGWRVMDSSNRELGPLIEPRYPIGTPEYDAYAEELRAELRKWSAGEPPYDHSWLDV